MRDYFHSFCILKVVDIPIKMSISKFYKKFTTKIKRLIGYQLLSIYSYFSFYQEVAHRIYSRLKAQLNLEQFINTYVNPIMIFNVIFNQTNESYFDPLNVTTIIIFAKNGSKKAYFANNLRKSLLSITSLLVVVCKKKRENRFCFP